MHSIHCTGLPAVVNPLMLPAAAQRRKWAPEEPDTTNPPSPEASPVTVPQPCAAQSRRELETELTTNPAVLQEAAVQLSRCAPFRLKPLEARLPPPTAMLRTW